MQTSSADTTIIGGGVVGLAVALGLLRAGQSVTVLDGSDADHRASLGNFGLTWLQGKGAWFPPYALWTWDAVNAWPRFAADLKDLSGIDPAFAPCGGYEFFTEQAGFDEVVAELKAQSETLGPAFTYEVLQGESLKQALPGIGDAVVGATFSPHDGHVNPLRLLAALRRAVLNLNGTLLNDWTVADVTQSRGTYVLTSDMQQQHQTPKVILCAGLGAADLAPKFGFRTQVRPQRGELLITERLRSNLPFLSSTIRQVDEGGVQIGGTKANAGFDDRETVGRMKFLAQHAVDVWPALKDVNVVRSWGALRVMTPDGYPVYARAPDEGEAFLVTCHSGVTLAPMHASRLVDWITGTEDAPDLEAFRDGRV